MPTPEEREKGKRFHDYVKKMREEQIRKEIEHEYQLIDISLKLDDANKARIRAEMDRDRNATKLAKEIVKEILNPDTPQKLTKKEKIKLRALEISEQNKLEIIAKAAKKR